MARSDPSDHVLLPPCCSQHSRRSVIVTQQTTEPMATLDLAIASADMSIGLNDHVGYALVISFPVIVEHELFHRTTKMILAQGNHLAQTFLFNRSNKTFGVCIQIRTARRLCLPKSPSGTDLKRNGSEFESR